MARHLQSVVSGDKFSVLKLTYKFLNFTPFNKFAE